MRTISFISQSQKQPFADALQKTPGLSLFLIKLQGLSFYQKDTPKEVFSCEYCEIFNSFFIEQLVASSAKSQKS